MNCKVCGKPSGTYVFCVECNNLKSQGKIIKCEKCNDWHLVDKKCKCESSQKQERQVIGDGTCVVCGEAAPNGHLCRECYYDMKDYYSTTFDKNSKAFELKDYYFNLKQNIFNFFTLCRGWSDTDD